MHPLRIVLGNKPDWSARMLPLLQNSFEVADAPLAASHAGWADVVVPLQLADYRILGATPQFQGKALFPTPETVALCHDKMRFRNWFRNCFDLIYLPNETASSPLVIARPRQGGWGSDAVVISTADQAQLAESRMNSNLFIEEYIPGNTEYAQHILFDEGQILYSALATHVHETEVYIQGKGCRPVRTTMQESNDVPKIFAEVLAALNYSGTACIDYKIDASGQIKIFEINPRMGGSLMNLTHSYVRAYAIYLQSKATRS
ncbi:ATP-grasp domain-containing protein [Janthinobacterium sp. 17J80-10]|uniref:ATP-grasp domain-containing protein n=1 Tax=Janthinobacterium sp. 17J80-10 TaxID=2497863 RepID=UPI00100593EB|nr:ATP-grasp domain-containing protein [Janthinobacterium sp. 17J80-10]QAU35570.1 ATP-grasp domain-containing protein [Janthinobacterium sp. 17J80-10]